MTGKFKITLQWSKFYAKSSHPWTWNFKPEGLHNVGKSFTNSYLIFSYFLIPRNLKFFLEMKTYDFYNCLWWDLKKGLVPLWPDARAVVAEIYTCKSCDIQLTEQDWKTKTEKHFSLQGCTIMPDYNWIDNLLDYK